MDRDVVAVHSVGGTQQSGGKSPTYVYYNCRNRLLFAGTHLSRHDRRSWAVLSPKYAWAVMGRGGRRALARRAVPLFVAAVRGTMAGFLIAHRNGLSMTRN